MIKESRFHAWSDLFQRHPEPHLVVGWTRNVNRWRDEGFFDLIGVQQPAGRYAVKRDFDEKRGQYLLLAAFERESDARDLADAAGAETTKRYPRRRRSSLQAMDLARRRQLEPRAGWVRNRAPAGRTLELSCLERPGVPRSRR